MPLEVVRSLMNDIERAFQQCPDCGRYLVQLAPHRCRSEDTGNPKREQRMQIAATDTRHDDDPVLVLPTRGVDGSYAYHEVGDDGLPQCGGAGAIDDDSWRTVTRRDAKARGKSPCKTCLRLASDPAEVNDSAAASGNGSA
jgi:hypothetical protein